MTEKQAAEWRQDAQDTLNKLDLDKHNKDNYILLGATMAILGRDMLMGEITRVEPETTTQGEIEAVQYIPSPTSKIDTILATLAADFAPYQETKSAFIIEPTSQNENAVLDDLRIVLNDLKQLFSVLWQSSALQTERDEIRNFFQFYVDRYNIGKTSD